MPRNVDHDERRSEIIWAAWRVMAADGIAAATTRGIADEAGYSYGVLAHYFADKTEILGCALVAGHGRIDARADVRNEGKRGLAALRTLLLEHLPLDEQRTQEALVEVGFWGKSADNQELTKIVNAETDRLWDRVTARLTEAADDGELPAGADLDLAANACVALIESLTLRVVLYPARADPDDQLALLDALLAGLAYGH